MVVPFYAIYECADGKYLSVAPIEGISISFPRTSGPRRCRPACAVRPGALAELRERIASVLATRTRDEWAAVFETTDCCVAPVLTFDEARVYGHHLDRGTFVDDTELAVIPGFSNTRRTHGPVAVVGRGRHRRGPARSRMEHG